MLTIYKASAGSGKTFQLALQYLKMVLGRKDPGASRWRLNEALLGDRPSHTHRHILAITFTNKATEEMKSRIIASLDELARAKEPKDHDYVKPLTAEFGCTFEQLRTAARNAMVSVLVDFSFFNVSTIDSFFQTVLRTFARELGIQGDYNIEINAGNAVNSALSLLLDDLDRNDGDKEVANARKRIRQWLDRYSIDQKKKFNPFERNSYDFNNLAEMVKKIYQEDFKGLKEELLGYLADPTNLPRFKKAVESNLPRVKAMVMAAGHKVGAAITASGQEKYLTSYNATFFEKLRQGDFDFDNQTAALERMVKGTREIGKTEYSLKKGGVLNDDYIAAIDNLSEDIRRAYSYHARIKLLLTCIPQLEFIYLVMQYIERVCEQDNILILDDTSTYISRIINGSEIPFIYEHLGTHLQHFLIDEFQDTSRLQWTNLFPLLSNGHSQGEDGLIIGDVKQAIYRFRNSDATILGNDLENKCFPHPEERVVMGTNPEENRNYRTAHGIVRFNNTILPRFSELALDVTAPAAYSGAAIKQLCAKQKAHLKSRIALYPYDYSIKKRGDDQPEYDLEGDMLAQPIIPDEETKIKVLIKELRRQHDEENIKWSDIAVLYRSSSNMEVPLKAIIEAGIPVQSSDSLFLRNATSVRLIVGMLAMIAEAGLPKSRKAVNESPKVKYQKVDPVLFESRYNFFMSQGNSNGEPLHPVEAIRRALDTSLQPAGAAKTPADTLKSILSKHPATLVATIEAILAENLIPANVVLDERAYISAFTDLALQYSEIYDNDLNGFLTWWEARSKKAAISPPPGSDALRVLSVHSAKGLEFDCVHLIDFDWDLVDDRENVWLDIRPADSVHAANPTGIDMDLDVARDLYPPAFCFSLKDPLVGCEFSPFTDYLNGQRQEMRIDALNVAYVALTRPISQLNVYFAINSQEPLKEVNTVGDALYAVMAEYVNNGAFPFDPQYDLEIQRDCINADTKSVLLKMDETTPLSDEDLKDKIKKENEKKEKKEKNRELANIYAGQYPSVFNSDVITKVVVSSVITDPESQRSEQEEKAREKEILESAQRGLDLHDILSQIHHFDASSDNADEVFEKAFAKIKASRNISPEEEAEYRRTVTSMLGNPLAARWFNRENRVDTEITYFRFANSNTEKEDGFRRIDRLVETPDGNVEIVDYKFTQDVKKAHDIQVKDYICSVSEIMPGRKIRGFLWYVDRNEILEVT